MAFGIHRVEKAKAGDLYGLELEANRTEKDRHNFPKSNIDWERTKYNYYFEKTDDWETAIPRIIKEHGITKTIRKDAVLMIDGLYTASPEWFEGKTPEEIKEYFRECLDFHRAHYGVVFNAVVHMDEGTPHMAVASVPLVKNEDGSYSLSAKKLLGGRVDFHEKQDDFYNDVSKGYGLERGEVTTPEARREHLDVLDYKLMMRTEEIKAAEADKVELETQKEELETKVGKLEQIGLVMDRLAVKVISVFERIGTIFYRGFEKLCSVIEARGVIREADLDRADCTMKRCGKVTDMDTGEVAQLYFPRTNAGDSVTWNGTTPVAIEDEGEYCFGFKKDGKKVEFCPADEWETIFNEENRDDIPLGIAPEKEDILNDIDKMETLLAPEVDTPDEEPEDDYFDAEDILNNTDTEDEDGTDDIDRTED